MSSTPSNDSSSIIAFPVRAASAGPRRRQQGDRRSIEELLDSLKSRRGRLEDRLSLVSLAIEKLESQVATKRKIEILPGSPA